MSRPPRELVEEWTGYPLTTIPRLTDYNWSYYQLRCEFFDWLMHEEAMGRGYRGARYAWDQFTRHNVPGQGQRWRAEMVPRSFPQRTPMEVEVLEPEKGDLFPQITEDFQARGYTETWRGRQTNR
jgi:hypothetical protein